MHGSVTDYPSVASGNHPSLLWTVVVMLGIVALALIMVGGR